MTSRIANVRSITTRYHGLKPGVIPTLDQIKVACAAATKRGVQFGSDGRCYVPFQPSSPRLPDGSHGRWERGRVVPRKRSQL